MKLGQAGDTGLAYNSINAKSAIVADDGTWVLYYSLVHPERSFVGAIGRATAPSPLGPWTSDPQPVLEHGPDGAWDGKHVGNASVVKTDDGYRMYYTGTGSYQVGAFKEEYENVGMATSPDGIAWTKHDDPATGDALYGASDPVFLISVTENAWDSWKLTDVNAQKTADGWAMVYRGSGFPPQAQSEWPSATTA